MTNTCPTCGCTTDTPALAFLHERFHEDGYLSAFLLPTLLPPVAAVMEAYATKERERVAEVLKTEIMALLAQEKRAFGEESKAHFAAIRDCVESIALTLGVEV